MPTYNYLILYNNTKLLILQFCIYIIILLQICINKLPRSRAARYLEYRIQQSEVRILLKIFDFWILAPKQSFEDFF